MTLFGNKHANQNQNQNPGTDANAPYGAGAGAPYDNSPAGAGAGGYAQRGGQRQQQADRRYAAPGAPGAGTAAESGYARGAQGPGFDDTRGGAGAQPAMPPRTDGAGQPVHPGSTAGRSGGGGRLAGKVEHAVGSALGSQNLKARGAAKEQEAGALRAQAAELGEAERLEAAALARRERAVAHGAHPQYRHLGGQNPGAGGGAGAANPNEVGGGANYGDSGAGGAGGGAARRGY